MISLLIYIWVNRLYHAVDACHSLPSSIKNYNHGWRRPRSMKKTGTAHAAQFATVLTRWTGTKSNERSCRPGSRCVMITIISMLRHTASRKSPTCPYKNWVHESTRIVCHTSQIFCRRNREAISSRKHPWSKSRRQKSRGLVPCLSRG